MKAFIYLLFIFALLSSCQNEKENNWKNLDSPPSKNQLVKWEKINKFEWKNLSFPLWFDAELISLKEIKKIELDFITYNFTDTQSFYVDTLPYRKRIMIFKKNGEVEKVINTEYNAAIKISETTFTYPIDVNEIGYSLPIVSNKINFGKNKLRSQLNTMEELQQFQRLLLVENHEDYYRFIDENDIRKKSHYFIVDSSKWNVTYIDQKFRPQGIDIYYYGTPTRYTSAFSLTNMVEKSMRIDQEKYANGVIKSQSFYEKDFITHRSFDFDVEGNCTGFTDSLSTIDNVFIHLEKGVVHYQNGLPNHLLVYNEEDDSLISPIKKITFSYFFNE